MLIVARAAVGRIERVCDLYMLRDTDSYRGDALIRINREAKQINCN